VIAHENAVAIARHGATPDYDYTDGGEARGYAYDAYSCAIQEGRISSDERPGKNDQRTEGS
jgi:hypothetical protein